MKLPTSKKVLPPRAQYLDLRAIDHLLGHLQHGRIGALPVSLLYFQLEAFLASSERNYSPAVGSIPKRLLEHNKQLRKLLLCELAPIDADLAFSYDASTKHTDIRACRRA